MKNVTKEQLRAFWESCLTPEKLLQRLEKAEAKGVEGLSVVSLSSNEVPHGMTAKAVGRLLGKGLVEASGGSARDGSVLWRITAGGRRYLATLRKEQAEERARTFTGWLQPSLFVEVE